MLRDSGIYMVTASTYLKAHHFQTHERLQFLHDNLLSLAGIYGWELHAWAVLSNHYHFVAKSPQNAANLSEWIGKLHQLTAAKINQLDNTPNKKVWFQYWDSKITIHTSYLARLNYVHQNPRKHGLVSQAASYSWCSASHFELHAAKSFVKSVYSFDVNKVQVYDEF
jgi:putative transposase